MALRGLAALLVLTAQPLLAEEALLSISFGPDRLDIAPAGLIAVDLHLNEAVPNLRVTLSAAMAPPLAALTGHHVGETGAIRVCGRIVSEPVLRATIESPVFMISDPDARDIRRLGQVLQARDCAPGT